MKTLRVLVPLDGSQLSQAVLPHVLALGAADVTLLRVLESPGLFGGEAPDAREREAQAQKELEGIAARLQGKGVSRVQSVLRRGAAVDEAVAVANEQGVGLIALTTHGKSGFDRQTLGHVAARLLRTAPVPVLAVQAAAAADPRPSRLLERVLVPHDGSELASRAIEALALLGAAGKGRLEVFGVVESLEAVAVPGEAAREGPGDLATRYTRLRCEGLERDLHVVAKRAADLGLPADAKVDVGRPAARILDRAEASGATLIAMTTHGRSGLTRWALGSVTEQVLHATSVPLLVCR